MRGKLLVEKFIKVLGTAKMPNLISKAGVSGCFTKGSGKLFTNFPGKLPKAAVAISVVSCNTWFLSEWSGTERKFSYRWL
jgi:hypothetical protein